jgi:putative ABC transport system permease protein
VAFSVKQNTHEIGVRRALGARGLSVVRGFLVRGLRLGAIAALGTTAAFAVTRLLDSVCCTASAPPMPVRSLALSPFVLGAVVMATLIPVWRGARTNPLTALRRS